MPDSMAWNHPPKHHRNPRFDDPEATARAAALGYEPGRDAAPRLLAQGTGAVADRILELARDHDIPMRQDPMLLSVLGALDVGTEIPPELYNVIAEVLAWAYRADQRAGDRHQRRAA